jgi:hypothetical protein
MIVVRVIGFFGERCSFGVDSRFGVDFILGNFGVVGVVAHILYFSVVSLIVSVVVVLVVRSSFLEIRNMDIRMEVSVSPSASFRIFTGWSKVKRLWITTVVI